MDKPLPTALLCGAVLMLTACATGAGGDEASDDADATILIAGASDLQPAFTELGERFEQEVGVEVEFDFGSSGQIAQRIIEGQPVDLFASANAAFVDEVVGAGVGDPSTRSTYAFGRIVLWASAGRWADWGSLEEAVADEDVITFAIANPEHAPYGTAGRQALDATGVSDDVDDRLVLGENISDTQRLIETGNADVGIIALSLAIAADERGVGRWLLLDEGLHEPLQQDLIVTATDPEQAALATRFVEYVDSEDGRDLMRRFGFVLPGETTEG